MPSTKVTTKKGTKPTIEEQQMLHEYQPKGNPLLSSKWSNAPTSPHRARTADNVTEKRGTPVLWDPLHDASPRKKQRFALLAECEDLETRSLLWKEEMEKKELRQAREEDAAEVSRAPRSHVLTRLLTSVKDCRSPCAGRTASRGVACCRRGEDCYGDTAQCCDLLQEQRDRRRPGNGQRVFPTGE
jgi:hypothetical protein